MKNLQFSSKLLITTLLTLAFASLASAQASRTWVSGVGDDANMCTRITPCRTFAGTMPKTAAGGEVDCLDPGNFGSFTITKAITVDCGGAGLAGAISGNGGSTIIVNAGANDIVTIRNLSISGNGISPGVNGVQFLAGGTLHLEALRIFSFSNNCVDVNASAIVQITIENTTISECAFSGISLLTTGSNTVSGDIHAVRVFDATTGVNAQNGTRLTIRDSNIAISNIGINQSGLAAASSVVTVVGSTVAQSNTALQSITGAFLAAFGNSFIGDATVYRQNGGQIFTGTDNATFAQGATGANSGNVPKT